MIRPKRNPNVQTKMLPDGHVVIFSNDSDWAHTITPLAAIAWEYCDANILWKKHKSGLAYTEEPVATEIQPAIVRY